MIVVVVAGRPLVMNRQLDRADAALMAFLPGSEGGGAIADALFGDYNPSGRLSVSWPRSVDQFPLAYNEPGAVRPALRVRPRAQLHEVRRAKSLDGPRARSGRGETARFDVRVANTGKVNGDHTLLAFAQPVSGAGRGELAGFQRTWVRHGRRVVRADRRRLDAARAGRATGSRWAG